MHTEIFRLSEKWYRKLTNKTCMYVNEREWRTQREIRTHTHTVQSHKNIKHITYCY